jgi:hypothetical protein
MAMAAMKGTRLQFVVVPLEKTVMRKHYLLDSKEVGSGKKTRTIVSRTEKEVEEPGGFMAYFPQGHCMRIKNARLLHHYGLDRTPKVINFDGLTDPTNPINQMIMADSDAGRSNAFKRLQDAIIKRCRRIPGADQFADDVSEAA